MKHAGGMVVQWLCGWAYQLVVVSAGLGGKKMDGELVRYIS